MLQPKLWNSRSTQHAVKYLSLTSYLQQPMKAPLIPVLFLHCNLSGSYLFKTKGKIWEGGRKKLLYGTSWRPWYPPTLVSKSCLLAHKHCAWVKYPQAIQLISADTCTIFRNIPRNGRNNTHPK